MVLRRWIVTGPEIPRIINEFEASMVTECTENEQSAKHHEDTRGLQSLFYGDVVSLTRTIEEMGNPFMEETDDLFSLDRYQTDNGLFECIGKTTEGRRGWNGTL